MSEIEVVQFPRSRYMHLAKSGDLNTVCGKKIPKKTVKYLSLSSVKLCEKCLAYIGREMIWDYLGFDMLGDQERTLR